MTAIAALLDRPLLDLAFGVAALGSACVVSAVAFFWVGFRIAEVPAWVGFEGMFGLGEQIPAGNARAVPREVADRLKAIKDRRASSAERSSLDELAVAMGRPHPGPSISPVVRSKTKTAGIDRHA